MGEGPVRASVINSTGRVKLLLWLAVSDAIWLDTISMSVRVRAFTVITRFDDNPVAVAAAGVLVTTRQRTVAEGTRFGRNQKYKLTGSINKPDKATPSYCT